MAIFYGEEPDIETLKKARNYRGLIKALRHKNLDIQWQASSALAGLGTEGMDHLLSALKTRNKDIRLGIIEALGEIRDPRAVEPLIGLLRDKDNEVRWEAALALGEMADPRALGPLEGALRDPDRYVRYGSAVALEKMGWSPDEPATLAFLFAGKQEWDMLADMGKDAIPSLDIAAKDNDKSVRMMAVRTLGRIGEEKAIPLLYRAIRDPDDQVRWEAVMASQKCGISPRYLPRALARRPRTRKNPNIAAFLNFVLPGVGYFYLGKWWGILIFQIDIYATVWLFETQGQFITFDYLLPLYGIIAIHAWYIARQMPDL
ncbi:MAG: HEAT repeat domain-containing protein [Methanoregulaceae archaeon]|jgi:HEAT repeat protein|nr:HEAT repeat domain-containing protein [Methanoregulaceae archaeon]MCU0628226.1 HEAT repeat domain-containing protein [Methanoregulaceae archaeon]